MVVVKWAAHLPPPVTVAQAPPARLRPAAAESNPQFPIEGILSLSRRARASCSLVGSPAESSEHARVREGGASGVYVSTAKRSDSESAADKGKETAREMGGTSVAEGGSGGREFPALGGNKGKN